MQASCSWLDEVSRNRQLAEAESELLALTMRRLEVKHAFYQWTRAEDDAIRRLMARRYARKTKTKPSQSSREIRELADTLGRSYRAVHRRMERLRKRLIHRKPAHPQLSQSLNGHGSLDSGDGQQSDPYKTLPSAEAEGRP